MKFLKYFPTAIFASILCLFFQPAYSDLLDHELEELDYAQEEAAVDVTSEFLAKNYYKKPERPKYIDSWTPYMAPKDIGKNEPYPFVQTNIGFGLLRFSHIRGSLSTSHSGENLGSPHRIQGGLNYSRTPLVEIVSGFKIFNWLEVAFSYQHQGDIDVQTSVQYVPSSNNILQNYAQFSSSLRLDSFAVKVYFSLPKSIIWKMISYNPYIGVAAGPSWQSWTNMRLDDVSRFSGVAALANDAGFKNKYCANCLFMADPGIKIQSVLPERVVGVVLGCKFNIWGQARNLGKPSQNLNYAHVGLRNPIRVKTIYQFAPYFGFQLDF